MKLLLQHGADAAAHDSTNGSTALILAAAQGHIECVTSLLAASGTSPAERDSEGRSPILYAARRGHVEILRLLLTAAPTEVDATDETGLTPLMAAAHAGQLDAVSELLQAAASVYTRDQTGATALHAEHGAVASMWHRSCIQAGARSDARDEEGNLPVDVAEDAALRDMLSAALDEQYEHWSEKSYDSAQDDRPWH